LIFKDEIDFDLKKVINNPKDFLNKLELSKKEKLRAIELMIENKNENKEKILENINSIIYKINKIAYKNITNRLKELMKEDNLEAFKKYSEIMKIAKKNHII
jgi:nicotinic acid mononucleotide adenylyltransferase